MTANHECDATRPALRKRIDPSRVPAHCGAETAAGAVAGTRLNQRDPAPYVKHSAPAAVFVQNGRLDKEIPEGIVRKSSAYFQQPKRLEFYDAGHELNAAARRDRATWLQQRFKLKQVDFRGAGRDSAVALVKLS